MFSKRELEGYVLIDHRNSPGVSHEQAQRGLVAVPGGTMLESPTFLCSRCQKTIILNPDRSRSRGYCRKCDHDICDGCSLMLKLNHECSLDTCYHIKRITYT